MQSLDERDDDRATTPDSAHLWPVTARVDREGRLRIGGCDVEQLAHEHGTPLYLYDVATLLTQCRAFKQAFRAYPATTIAYAAKAYLSPALCRILAQEGMELDAVSAGELGMAVAGGFAPDQIHLHGNFKPDAELAYALDAGVGRVVADSLYEIERIESLAAERERQQRVWLRLCPDVRVETHPHDQTGLADSKFGLDVASGAADTAVERVLASSHLELVGLHAHAGSQVFDPAPLAAVTAFLLAFAAHARDRFGVTIGEISPGGGWGVAYHPDEADPPVERYAEAVTGALMEGVRRWNLVPPRLIVEPGRAIVARAGVALYTAGPGKRVPGGRTFVAMDGGMGDNVRPALYGARYHACLPARMRDNKEEPVCLVGRYCESGDVLVQAVSLPAVAPGDVVAMPVSGAYHLTMASNYNAVLRPAVVFVQDGVARIVRHRETLDDLLRLEAEAG